MIPPRALPLFAPLTPPPPPPSSPLPSSPPPVPSLPSVSLSSADPERDRRSLPRRWLGRHRRPRLREAVCPRDHGAAAAAPRHLPRRAAASKGLAPLWPARHGQDVDREGEHCGRSRKRQLLHVCCYYEYICIAIATLYHLTCIIIRRSRPTRPPPSSPSRPARS